MALYTLSLFHGLNPHSHILLLSLAKVVLAFAAFVDFVIDID